MIIPIKEIILEGNISKNYRKLLKTKNKIIKNEKIMMPISGGIGSIIGTGIGAGLDNGIKLINNDINNDGETDNTYHIPHLIMGSIGGLMGARVGKEISKRKNYIPVISGHQNDRNYRELSDELEKNKDLEGLKHLLNSKQSKYNVYYINEAIKRVNDGKNESSN